MNPNEAVAVPLTPTTQMLDAGRIAAFRVLFPQGTPFEEADCQAAAYAAYQAMVRTHISGLPGPSEPSKPGTVSLATWRTRDAGKIMDEAAANAKEPPHA